MSGAASGLFGRARTAGSVIALCLLALAALLSGTDRQSREFPNSPAFVGWPYDTGAARAHAAVAFVRTGPASAIGYARRAILSDPISAQAISMLGRAELYAQQMPLAHKAFEVSGQLGWRDSMTQIYWLDQAMQSGDFTIASQRLDALLRQYPNDANRDRFLAVLTAVPEARNALAERLRLSPVWANEFALSLKDVPDDQILQRVDIMQRVGRGIWDCNSTGPLTQKLIDQGLLDQAQALWRLNCVSGSSLLYDGHFEQFDTLKQSTAFGWHVPNRGDVDLAVTRDRQGAKNLAIEVNADVTLPILRQLIVLKPGRYELTMRMPDTDASSAMALEISLSCNPNLAEANRPSAVPGKSDSWKQDFTVSDECPARELVFWLAPKAAVHLTDLRLVNLGGQSTN